MIARLPPCGALARKMARKGVRLRKRSPHPSSGFGDEKIRAALEAAGVEFIAENGGGAGVRLKKL
jgi:hypothetical protein